MKVSFLPGLLIASSLSLLMTCTTVESPKTISLITVDPGHFHAALVQKSMYDNVDSVVHVYAPEGTDVKMHLDRIAAYNTRELRPTHWEEKVYTGPDFFEKMIAEKSGNVVVLAGNNQKKTSYISQSLAAGFHVLSDKPMAINKENFEMLKAAFELAKSKNLLLYDIMTERFEITSILQKEFSMSTELFGKLQVGTPEQPAVTKVSVHHFYKYVSGNVLTRPSWFMDVNQQGEGIVDVMTHLVDLVQWECFPDQVLDYASDIQINTAKRWPTEMRLSEFKTITKTDGFPDFLNRTIVNDTILPVYCNGEINYKIKGIHAQVSVQWNYKAPEGGGDTHYSIMRGTRATLTIRQGEAEQYKTKLYIQAVDENDATFDNAVMDAVRKIQGKLSGVQVKKMGKEWEVLVEDSYRENHEAHFARVTEKFLEYLKNRNMPEWEVPNMIAKYYTTTQAREMALKNQP